MSRIQHFMLVVIFLWATARSIGVVISPDFWSDVSKAFRLIMHAIGLQ